MVFSKKVRAGNRRTYFFDVRRTKGDDFYLTLTESTKKFNDQGFERHKIFLYKEDFNRFLTNLEEVVNYIKTELMPDYDYEEFDRRHEEWEAQNGDENGSGEDNEGRERRPPRQFGGGGSFDRSSTPRPERPERPPREERPERPQREERPPRRFDERPAEPDDDMSW